LLGACLLHERNKRPTTGKAANDPGPKREEGRQANCWPVRDFRRTVTLPAQVSQAVVGMGHATARVATRHVIAIL
jgi:hypothetical protein